MSKEERVIIYARQSSGEDDISASVEQQIMNCQQLARECGYSVTGIFRDLNISGKFYPDTPKSILEKAEENDMMRFIENGHKVHAIVSPYKTVSVDTPKDLALVNEILKEKQHG